MQYQKTHHWLTFQLDLHRAPFDFWTLLGEAHAKCDFLANIPLQPETADRLHTVYLAKGARATTAIEGNTLSEEDVEMLVGGNLTLPPSKEYLGIEVSNIIDACNEILEEIMNGITPPLNLERIKELNAKALQGLRSDDWIVPGEIRKIDVVVGRYKPPASAECGYLLQRLCGWLHEIDSLSSSLGLGASILKAIVAHLYLAWIHPFGDGNGRTARLMEHQILISQGLPSPATHLLSNHYNETRTEYYRLLDQSTRKRNGAIEFIRYALQGLVDGLTEQINAVSDQIWNDVWINYVHSKFRELTGPANARRRLLVLELSRFDGDPAQRKIKEPGMPVDDETRRHPPYTHRDIRTLTPALFEAYYGKTSKTITRDINALVKSGLIRRMPGGVIANKEPLLAFLPLSGAS